MARATETAPPLDLKGAAIWKGALEPAEQIALVADVREIVRAAPLFRPETRSGRRMSVRMTSAGALGWVSDRRGYRYEARHPEIGAPWPPIPERVLEIWRLYADWPTPPDAMPVNFYEAGAKMGLHRDGDEADLEAPVLSISLGDPAIFRVGGRERSDPTASCRLESGDVARLSGPARLAYHGIDRVLSGGSSLLAAGGRLNLTLRVAGP